MLHITNGESTRNGILESGISGEVLAWNDVLHEGPTPPGLPLEEMSQVRSRFIADYYAQPYEEVANDFTRRDTTLAHFRDHEEVVLWFEHDLYDQLQLIQILDWFAQHNPGATRLRLISINTFPGIDNFMGLGQLTPAQLASLFDTRQDVTIAMLNLSSEAWKAFCASTPTAIEAIMRTDTTALPFLKQALFRHLEEFPAVENGLSRIEKHILEVVVSGARKPAEIFRAEIEKEESAFMGDITFWIHMTSLCDGPKPLFKLADGGAFSLPANGAYQEAFLEQVLVPTDEGHAVLSGQADWITICGGIDRWLGGVHLQGQGPLWRWDARRKALSLT